jgi:hypothetical protein
MVKQGKGKRKGKTGEAKAGDGAGALLRPAKSKDKSGAGKGGGDSKRKPVKKTSKPWVEPSDEAVDEGKEQAPAAAALEQAGQQQQAAVDDRPAWVCVVCSGASPAVLDKVRRRQRVNRVGDGSAEH